MISAQTWRHFWGRLRAVPLHAYPRVLRQRLRQLQWRWSATETPSRITDTDLAQVFGVAHVNELAAHFEQRGVRFFFDRPAAVRAGVLVEACSGARERLLVRGGELLAHRIDVLGSGPVQCGGQLPWRRDIKSGHEWPCVHFTRLKIVDAQAGFDIKVPWELSRFHHAVTLGQCYALSGAEHFAHEFVQQLRDWWADNPPEFGPNWANAMEVSIRAANLIWAFELVRDSAAADSVFVVDFLRSMVEHGRYIYAHLEAGWPGSNHYLADLCGLIWLGIYCAPRAGEEVRWLPLALQLMERELPLQVYPDGASYEASTAYHLLVTEMLLHTAAFMRLNTVPAGPQLTHLLPLMADAVAGLVRPDGELPLFGDCDSGRWLALESDTPALRTGQDARGVLALAAALFSQPGWLYAGEGPARLETAIWVHGSDIVKISAVSPDSAAANTERLRALPDAGWYVLRAGGQYLAINASGNGAQGWGFHAHNDALSFELCAGLRSFLVDPGSFVYTGNFAARNEFRATGMHNTVCISGREINRVPAADLFRMENDTTLVVQELLVEGEKRVFQAARISRVGARVVGLHTRRIEWLPEFSGWWIADEWSGGAGNDAANGEVFFHFASLPVIVDGVVARTVCESGQNLALIPCNIINVQPVATLEMGSTGFRYGSLLAAPVVRYAVTGQAFSVVACVYNEHQDYELLRKNVAAHTWSKVSRPLTSNLSV